MKKTVISGILTIGLAAIIGCTPSEAQIKATATAIGYAAGLVASDTNISDDARNAIVAILNEVRVCIPEEGKSFAETWNPVIKEKVADLVASGKIDAKTGTLVEVTATFASEGVDYLFEVRYPEARKYTDLVAAGASAAIDGFLEAFKPVNAKDRRTDIPCDEDAYIFFRSIGRKHFSK